MIIYGELLLHNNLISMLMKKYAKWVGIAVITPFVLILLLAVLLYLPPVQNWAVKQVASYASESTGMDISVKHVQLVSLSSWEWKA